jgi:hypothetical protein
MTSGSACRTSTATGSSTRMGQEEPRPVFEQPRCGRGAEVDRTVTTLLRASPSWQERPAWACLMRGRPAQANSKPVAGLPPRAGGD